MQGAGPGSQGQGIDRKPQGGSTETDDTRIIAEVIAILLQITAELTGFDEGIHDAKGNVYL
jgi:hypothetical protein